ncbi:MAG TPA: regulatory protein RecX [Gemmatimonadaceae bacterium]|nr:regulatory protein RecX [Gemmatimonadaceae bacterium]
MVLIRQLTSAERHDDAALDMDLITAIVPALRPAGRFAVMVDGREAAVLSLDAIERLQLAVGCSVAGKGDAIELEVARLRTYDRASNLLAFRARSSAELARSLARKGEEPLTIDWALSRLREQGLVDDAAFARAFTRARVVGGKQSRRRVEQELARRGVPRPVGSEAIDAVLEEEAVDERAIVMDAARKKLRSLAGLDPVVRRRRLYAYLARRGYELDDIREVMATLGPGAGADDGAGDAG